MPEKIPHWTVKVWIERHYHANKKSTWFTTSMIFDTEFVREIPQFGDKVMWVLGLNTAMKMEVLSHDELRRVLEGETLFFDHPICDPAKYAKAWFNYFIPIGAQNSTKAMRESALDPWWMPVHGIHYIDNMRSARKPIREHKGKYPTRRKIYRAKVNKSRRKSQ